MGRGFEKIKNNYQIIMCGHDTVPSSTTPRRPTQKSKSSITKFCSTPYITYCCPYTAAMVFSAGLLKKYSQSYPGDVPSNIE